MGNYFLTYRSLQEENGIITCLRQQTYISMTYDIIWIIKSALGIPSAYYLYTAYFIAEATRIPPHVTWFH